MVELGLMMFLFAVANRFSGGGFGWDDLKLPGRGIFYAGLLVTGLLWALFGIAGLIAGVSFILWRIPGWYGGIDMGKVHGTAVRDWAVMCARGLVAFPIFVYAGAPFLFAAFCLLIGTIYLMWAAIENGDHIPAAEYTVGALWGASMWWLLT